MIHGLHHVAIGVPDLEAEGDAQLDALGEDLGEANEPTVAEKVLASPVTPEDKKITSGGTRNSDLSERHSLQRCFRYVACIRRQKKR